MVYKKRVAILLITILILVWGYVAISLWPDHRFYLTNTSHSIRIEVPKEIIRSKDCKRYQAFVQAQARPGFIPDDSCPWAKIEPIAHFIVHGIKFNIPREYLWTGSREPDGKKNSIALMFKYPEMTAGNAYRGDQSWNVNVMVSSTEICERQRKELCTQIGEDNYKRISRLDKYLHDPVKNSEYKPVKVRDLPELNMALYRFGEKYPKEIMVRGNVYKPDYWLKCLYGEQEEGWRPRCTTRFNINQELFIDYSFNKKAMLSHHDDLRDKILEKIQEFQQ